MSQVLQEGNLEFTYPDAWRLCRPESCSYHARHFSNFCGGCKEVDFLALDPGATLWLIEVKDYSWFRRINAMPIWEEVAVKARDVLSMLVGAAANDPVSTASLSRPGMQAGEFWTHAKKLRKLRVVLHLEIPKSPSKLHPGVKHHANLQTKLRQAVRVLDPHARVVDISGLPLTIESWTVKRVS